jgi:hypothetical protein
MGTLHSNYNHSGLVINNITLGDPAQECDEEGNVIENSGYSWDHPQFPNGTIEENGSIIIDQEDEL